MQTSTTVRGLGTAVGGLQVRTSLVRTVALVLFFFSGASALAYEVAWVRELSLSFGVSVYAVSAVTAAFMGGLALGSWLLGRGVTAAHPLRIYAGLQLGIAVCAVLSPLVFDWLTSFYVGVYNQLTPDFYTFNLLRFGLAALVLLVPATLMGGSFPVMSQGLARAASARGGDLGALYAVNTLGGVLGTFLTGLLLIRFLGTHEAIYLAAGIDVAVALIALLLSYRAAGIAEPPAEPAEVAATPVPKRDAVPEAPLRLSLAAARRLILWGFAVSGFVSLAYEVVWTRLLAVFTLNAVYSFTLMLSVFLVGLALGSFLMSRWADRAGDPLALFGHLELGIGLSSILMLYVFANLPSILDWLPPVTSYRREVITELVVAGLAMLAPTLLMGATFPVAARVYTSGTDRVGREVGRLYALNTVAAMLGALVAGFGLIPLLGLQKSVLLLAVINVLIGVSAILGGRRAPHWLGAGLVAAAAIAALLLPPGIYLGFRKGASPHLVYYSEGIDATVSVFNVPDPPLKISFVNGRSEVPTDPDSMRAFYVLGHLPPLLNPDSENALVVSFGNGIATGALSRHKVPRIHAVEIVAEQLEAAKFYGRENRNVLDYEGLDITIEDGRNYLLRSTERFDLITADATHPINSSSWALFTQEFYTLAKERLSEDGVMVQWLPFHDLAYQDYRNIVRTFQSVFPHTTLWYTSGTHSFLVATPKPLTKQQILDLQPHIDELDIADDAISARQLAAYFLMDEEEVRRYTEGARVVTDDTAFFLPARDKAQILRSFAPYR